MMDGDQLVSRKIGNHLGPDFLSDLPLDIIHCILQLVPIREAVRTCILSRRWRYIWATLPHLVFKEDECFEWKDLKTFKGFSCLKSLVLDNVKGPFEVVESLVANSPLLENFKYKGWTYSSELRISAPNLKCFNLDLSGDVGEISLYAPLVAEMELSLYQEDEEFTDKHGNYSGCNFTKLLGSCTNLETLRGYFYLTKYLSMGIESYDHSLVFHHLKYIHLYYMDVEDDDQLAFVGHLMMGAPNLEYLSIYHISDYATDPSYSDFGCGPNFTFNKLNEIKMDNICGSPGEMDAIKYLLKSSPVLDTMEIYYHDEITPEEITSSRGEILSYYRASPNAKVLWPACDADVQ